VLEILHSRTQRNASKGFYWLVAQFIAIVGLAAEHTFGWFNAVHEAFGDWAIVLHESSCWARRARAANSLLLRPSPGDEPSVYVRLLQTEGLQR